MRRPAAALLGTLAGTVLLVGAKYASTPPAANEDTVAAGDADPAAGAGLPGDQSVAPASTQPASGRNPTVAASTGRTTSTPGRTTGAPAATTAAPSCTNATGNGSNVDEPGVGTVTVTIQVCGGVLKTATSTLSRSNWDKNTAALPKLNSLAVANYKSNFSAIHYSGATLTSKAYQASLRSAMSKAGI